METLLTDVEEAKLNVNQNGFLDLEVDPQLDLFEEIRKLKKEKRIRC